MADVLTGIRARSLGGTSGSIWVWRCSAVEAQPYVPTPDRQLPLSIANFTPPVQRQVVGSSTVCNSVRRSAPTRIVGGIWVGKAA
jgi:hypothetical protein